MAEGTSAATAPSSGPGAKGGSSSGAWWKSLTARKKPKEEPGGTWPPPEPPEMHPAPARPLDSPDSQPLASGGSGSRRNLKISRSGRFKEKRKVRATLLAESPQRLFEGGGGGGATTSSPAPVHPSQETPGP